MTGAILVFEDEILEMRYPERYFVEEVKAEPLSPSVLVSKLQKHLPDSAEVTRIRCFDGADRTYKIYVSGADSYFVNPYTGEITGRDERSAFFSKTIRLHRFLMHSYKRGVDIPWGKMAVGYSTIAFIFIILTGLFVWYPKNKKALKNRLKIKLNGGNFRFWYDLHVAGGFYVSFFLLAMALTGLTWSFGWYRTGFYSLLGADMGKKSSGHHSSRPKGRYDIDYLQWDKVYAELNARYPKYKTLTLDKGSASVGTGFYGNTFATDKFTVDEATGKITKESLYQDQDHYGKLRGWVWAFHSGGWGGMTTRILTCLSAFLGSIFAVTGYYFWVRKKLRKRK